MLLVACDPGAGDPDATPPAPGLSDQRLGRVVSLAPSASRLVLALGAGARIVAVDEASRQIPALAALPVVDLARAEEVGADLVLVGDVAPLDAPLVEGLRARGTDVMAVGPHDFEDAFELCRGLGARLVGPASALSFEVRLSRELAGIGGAAREPRPRVAPVVRLAPLELASGHSFATDLIEIAGGSSVTHAAPETDEPRLTLGLDELAALSPDLLLFVSASELGESERRAVLASLPSAYRVEFFAFDADVAWMSDAADAARRLQALLEPISRELARSRRP